MDQALFLIQRRHLSLQSTQKWLDCTAAFLQRASSGVELQNQTDWMQVLEDITAQETDFNAALEELQTVDRQLEEYVESGVTSQVREQVEAIKSRKVEAKQQLEVHRGTLQR